MLPDWRALVIRMNLSPAIVKVRPAWRRLPYRLGRHPLPVPALSSPVLPSTPSVPAQSNGHSGQHGVLVAMGLNQPPTLPRDS